MFIFLNADFTLLFERNKKIWLSAKFGLLLHSTTLLLLHSIKAENIEFLIEQSILSSFQKYSEFLRNASLNFLRVKFLRIIAISNYRILEFLGVFVRKIKCPIYCGKCDWISLWNINKSANNCLLWLRAGKKQTSRWSSRNNGENVAKACGSMMELCYG